MPLPRYEVHNYTLDDTLVKANVNMIGLVVNSYVTDEHLADQVEALRVGDEQLSADGVCYIRRIK